MMIEGALVGILQALASHTWVHPGKAEVQREEKDVLAKSDAARREHCFLKLTYKSPSKIDPGTALVTHLEHTGLRGDTSRRHLQEPVVRQGKNRTFLTSMENG